LRHAADAADQHFPRLVVQPLEAAPVDAAHDRVVLVAQAEIERQLLVDVPTIAGEPRILVFTAGHLLELDALAVAAVETEQERGVLVPGVRAVTGLAGDI